MTLKADKILSLLLSSINIVEFLYLIEVEGVGALKYKAF